MLIYDSMRCSEGIVTTHSPYGPRINFVKATNYLSVCLLSTTFETVVVSFWQSKRCPGGQRRPCFCWRRMPSFVVKSRSSSQPPNDTEAYLVHLMIALLKTTPSPPPPPPPPPPPSKKKRTKTKQNKRDIK